MAEPTRPGGEWNDRLVDRARRGDRVAFDELTTHCWWAIAASAQRVVGDYHLAQDLAQEALLRAWRRMRHVAHGTQFRPWVSRIAKNLAIDRMRRRRKPDAAASLVERTDSQSFVCEEGPKFEFDAGSDGAQLKEAFGALAESERRVMVLRYARGFDLKSIARECGSSVATVKVRLYRGRTRLEARFSGDRRSPRATSAADQF